MTLPDHSALTQPRVVIADDDETILIIARSALEDEGFEVHQAADGSEALAVVQRVTPDVVLLDVEMPQMNGYSVCEEIRGNPSSVHTPIVMITGNEDIESIHRAYSVGATDFITKPINWPILQRRLRYILRSNRNFWALQESQERLSNAQRIARLGNWHWDPRTDEFDCSTEIVRIFGVDEADALDLRKTLLDRVHRSDRGMLHERVEHSIREGAPLSIEYRIVLPDGEQRDVLTEAHVVRDERARPIRFEGTSQDITQRKHAEERIRHLAYHDSLTGLANRALFREILVKATAEAQQQKKKVGLLYLDLDNFKLVNDTLGHPAGDELLKGVAERLVRSTRRADLVARADAVAGDAAVARLGGDEFTVLLTHLQEANEASLVAQRILERLAAPFTISGSKVVTGASLGITLWPDDATDVDDLLRHADTAMYHAKRRGKNQFEFYSKSMNEAARRRMLVETRLRRALGQDELRLLYQPKLEFATKEIRGAEALIRWEDPDEGIVHPDEFIPLAESTGLIVPIGEWVLRSACAQQAKWLTAGLSPGRLAVNVSEREFHDQTILESVKSALEESGLDGCHLEIEITESTLMKDEAASARVLRQLIELDVRIAIDDFGTGYSSLRYLRELPVTSLKIDRSFVLAIDADAGAREITSTIISMGKSLNLRTIAEGVETQAQWEILRDLGCDEVQGYLVSKPLRPAEFAQLLAK